MKKIFTITLSIFLMFPSSLIVKATDDEDTHGYINEINNSDSNHQQTQELNTDLGQGEDNEIQITSNSNESNSIASSGNCGDSDNLTWTLDEDGKLTISGTGKMFNYSVNLLPDWDASKIKSVEIKDGVTSIGGYVFLKCENLADITIPNSVTEIGDYAFFRNKNLKSITIPDSVTTIGKNAFSACEGLESINIPSNITKLEMYVFSYCSNLESVTIPDKVKSIGEHAFYKCSKISNITIPSSVTTIEKSAFEECTNLNSITIPSSVTSIGNDVFKNCSKVTDIYFYGTKDQWNNIESKVLSGMGTSQSPTIHIIVASGTCGENLTWELDGDGKLTISGTGPMYDYDDGNTAPWGNSDVTSVEIKEGATYIGKEAFEACSALTSIEIPGTVTSIGEYAFSQCDSLTSITIPDSVTTIGKYVFRDSKDLESASLPCKFKNAIDSTWFASTKVTSPTVRDHELNKVEKLDSTCTEDGYEEYWLCKKCQRMFTDENETKEITEPVVIKASHKYGKVTYFWSDDDKTCTATRTCEKGDDTQTETKPSMAEVVRNQSCTESELTKYSVTFENDAFEAQTKEVETADAKGHTLIKHDEIKPTCTKDGQVAYWECKDCQKKFSDENGTTPIEKPSIIKALDHSLKKLERQEATAIKEGNITYWYCGKCDKYFTDEKAQNEIAKADTIIAKIAPIIIKGDGASVTGGEKTTLSFTSNALFEDFKEVKVDNKVLDSKYYTVASGSTVVTLKADYVANLSIGKHTIGIVSESGTATATFTVNQKEVVPTASTTPTKSYSSKDKNHDGVVSCEEEMNSSNWDWSESKKACTYRLVSTSTN